MNRAVAMTRVVSGRERVALFWVTIVLALLVLSGIQTVNAHPSLLSSVKGLIVGVLMVSFGMWFVSMMFLRNLVRVPDPVRLSLITRVSLVSVGVALTAALVLLQNEFAGLIFADIGLTVFALDGWASLIPVALLGTLFYVTEQGYTYSAADSAGTVLSLVSIVALVYTLAALTRQRTERERLIADLQDAQQQLRQAASRDIELAALRERNRLARDMHDTLGHALVLIAVKIEAAQRLEAVDPVRAAKEWEATKALVRSTMSELRSSLAGLRVPALDERPFQKALAELVLATQQTSSIDVEMHLADGLDNLHRDVQEALYRVAQEALANVSRHASAQHAWLRVDADSETVCLDVEDDGVGLGEAPRNAGGHHYGIVGMRERMAALGGTLTLGPRSGGGTRLQARVLVREDADARYPHPVG
jgi:signal transduction histidine kinase